MNGARSLVVFDLDGTLIDSRRDLATSANQMLASYGAPPLAETAVAAMVGDGARKLVERALAAAGLDPKEPAALDRFLAAYDRELLSTTRPYPGVLDAVTEAASHAALAVLTNKPAGPTGRLLQAFGFAPHIQWAIGGDSDHPRKPDPAALVWLMSTAGVGPPETLLVGDSMVDVETARRAGARVCLARYGFGALRGPIDLRPGELEAVEPTDLAGVLADFLPDK